MSERFELGFSLEDSLLGISSNDFRVPDHHHHHHHHQSHIAQHSRREKLRVPPPPPQTSSPHHHHHHHMQDFSNHLLELPPIRYSNQQGDFVHVRSSSSSSSSIKNNCDLIYNNPAPMFSSEMLNYNNHHHGGHVLLAHKQDVVLHQESGKATAAAVGPVPEDEEEEEINTTTTTVSSSSTSHIVPTNFRFHQSQQQQQQQQQQQNCDWMSNFGGGGGSVCNQNPILIGGEILAPVPPSQPRNTKQTDLFSVAPVVYMKSSAAAAAVAVGSGSGCNNEYQEDVQSPLTTTTTTSNNRSKSSDISNQDCCQKLYGEVNFSRSPLFYQTNLHHQQVVTSSSTTTLGTQAGFNHQMGSGGVHHHVQQQQQQQLKIRETGHGSWVDGSGNELVLLPSYGNQNNHHHHHHHPSQLMVEEEEEEEEDEEGSTHQWNNGSTTTTGGGGNLESIVGDSTTTTTTNQAGLSLSLSSYPILAPELHAPHHQFGERFRSDNIMQTRPAAAMVTDSKASNVNADHNKGHGNSVEGIGGFSAAYARHCTGPLGPFTGYATILKNSKFLKPSQQLLEEFCSVTGPKIIKSCEVVVDENNNNNNNSSKDVGILSDNALNSDNGDGGSGRDGNSGGSSSFFSTYSNAATAGSADGSRPCQSYRPDFQQKKAKLMYMLEEVCRRYKQYHQQMQMVVSSFETVAGLDSATPYTSLALKTVSKHFRSLKNTIADQLSLMRKALGEDLSSPTSGTNINKGDATVPRLRFISQSLGKQGAARNSLGFLEPQQQVWRPQRGLPERSVAVLKAWLFEHFLHPYPTDTDKHMLASQTGLTRNQVSNWFINARVRVWKPMVEEMHMLETKGTTETDLNSGKSIQKPGGDVSGRNTSDQSSNMLMINAMSEKVPECSTMGLISNPEVGQSSEHWHQEKRSRMECQIQPGVLDGGLMGFVPYHHQRALEIGGIGSVSLTLGLRHSTGNVQQQQQHHPDHQLSRHYGGQMLHDFVG